MLRKWKSERIPSLSHLFESAACSGRTARDVLCGSGLLPMSGPVQLARRKGGHGRRAVFLHPIGLSGQFWEDLIIRVSDTLECITVDLRGHGGSPWDGHSFTIDDLAADVAAALKEEGGSPALIVGCSMGGMVAQGLALTAPHLVSGLLIANSAAILPPSAREGLKQRARMSLDEPEPHARDCLRRWFSSQFAQEQPNRVGAIYDALLATDPRVIAHSWLAISTLNYASRLRSFGGHAHIVTGEFDASSPPDGAAAHAALFPRSSTQVVAGAGHLTPYEMPDEFAQIILGLAAKAD